MFTRTAEPKSGAGFPPVTPNPEPQARRGAAASASRTPSLIAAGMTVEGVVRSDGEVHVDGVVRGDLQVQRLVVGDSALVDGTVLADSVEIRGRLTGSVVARTVRLFQAARVTADLTCDQVAVELGAQFEGRCQRPMDTAQPAIAAATSAEIIDFETESKQTA